MTPRTAAALEVDHLRVRFGDVVAVDDVTFTLAEGEVLAVLGPSGCGKSTLLRAVAGLERVDAGTITFAGQDLAPVPTFRRGFALMFQDGQLFPHLSVADNVGYPLRLRTSTKLGFKNPKWITAIEVTNTYRGGYWEDLGFNWHSGL